MFANINVSVLLSVFLMSQQLILPLQVPHLYASHPAVRDAKLTFATLDAFYYQFFEAFPIVYREVYKFRFGIVGLNCACPSNEPS